MVTVVALAGAWLFGVVVGIWLMIATDDEETR